MKIHNSPNWDTPEFLELQRKKVKANKKKLENDQLISELTFIIFACLIILLAIAIMM